MIRFQLRAMAVLGCLVLAGCTCAQPVEYKAVPPYLMPTAPTLPKVSAAEMAGLSDDVYSRVAERDRALRHYAEALRALLTIGEQKWRWKTN